MLTDGVGVGSACSQPGQPSQRHQRAARHSLTRRGLREQRAGAATARAPSLMHLLPRSPRNQHPSASTRCLQLLLLPARERPAGARDHSTRCLQSQLLPARAPCRSPQPFHTLPSITAAACTRPLPEPATIPQAAFNIAAAACTSALPEPATIPHAAFNHNCCLHERPAGARDSSCDHPGAGRLDLQTHAWRRRRPQEAVEARHSFPRDCGDGTPPSASLARTRSLYTTPPRPEAEFCACSPASGPRAADGEPAALQDWRLLGRRACLRSPPPGCPCGHPDVQLETVVPMHIPRAGCQGPRRHALESEPSALVCG